MTKLIALILGTLSVAPILYFVFILLFPLAAPLWTDGLKPVSDMPLEFDMMALVWVLAVVLFDIIYMYKTENVPREKRTLWLVVLILGTFIAVPFFWYFYMWKPLVRKA